MVAEFLMIAGEAQKIAESQGGGAEDVTLHADPVPVAAGHLDDRLNPFGQSKKAGPDTGHSDNGGLAVGNIDRVNAAL
jgi:hypothetical protein